MKPAVVAQKVLRASITLVLAVTFVFFVLRLSGDPVRIMLSDDASQLEIDQTRARLALDGTIIEQYLAYVRAILKGDFGTSFSQGRPALDIVLERVPNTLLLGGLSMLCVIVVGVGLGVAAAFNRNKLVDHAALTVSAISYSLPGFFVGVLLILVLAVQFRLVPTGGIGSWQQLIMPVIAASIGGVGGLTRFTRSSVLEVLGRLHIRAARAHGLPERRVVWQEALPNAAIPTVTVIGFMIGGVIAGSVVIETVFAWPGVGQLLQMAVARRDLPVVQVIILFIALTMTTANLCVDLLYGWLDPRIADGSSR